MPTLVNPDYSSNDINFSLAEVTRIYYAPNGTDITTGSAEDHLIPYTTGEVDVAPTTNTSRITLHNGKDFVTSQGEESNEFSIQMVMLSSDPMYIKLNTDRKNKANGTMNVFLRDGSGYAFQALCTRLSKPAEGDWVITATFQPFGVEDIDPPSS